MDEDDMAHHDEERSAIFEQRLERATELKAEGNEKFKEGDWRGALELYERGLYHGEFDETQYNFELMDQHRTQVDQTCAPLQLNAAACCLRLDEPRRAVELCARVLEKDPENPKALFRRGQGYQALHNLEKAKADLLKAAHAAPQDKAVRKTLTDVLTALKAEDDAARKLWAGKMQLKTESPAPADESQARPFRDDDAAPVAGQRGTCQRFIDSVLAWFGIEPQSRQDADKSAQAHPPIPPSGN